MYHTSNSLSKPVKASSASCTILTVYAVEQAHSQLALSPKWTGLGTWYRHAAGMCGTWKGHLKKASSQLPYTAGRCNWISSIFNILSYDIAILSGCCYSKLILSGAFGLACLCTKKLRHDPAVCESLLYHAVECYTLRELCLCRLRQ